MMRLVIIALVLSLGCAAGSTWVDPETGGKPSSEQHYTCMLERDAARNRGYRSYDSNEFRYNDNGGTVAYNTCMKSMGMERRYR